MNTTCLPDFEETLAIAQGSLDAAELTECHGVACGLLCRDQECSADAFVALLGQLELVAEPAENLQTSLQELLQSSRQQLADEDFGLSLWIPGDDVTLEDQTLALSQWCNGFLAGLGSGGQGSLQGMSDEANEALADLQQIARKSLSVCSDASIASL